MLYRERFYRRRHQQTLRSAESVFGTLFPKLPPVKSMLDVGCGVGTWLSAAKNMGCERVLGLDGPWVPKEMLRIPETSFRTTDLDAADALEEPAFDLAMSLEVAEHVQPENAARFVSLLTSASNVVLFGAAIPGQGGVGHINEQWPAYWAKLFADQGYRCLDVVRPAIWQSDIAYWYKQNTLLFVRESSIAEDPVLAALASSAPAGPPMAVVHPEAFERARLGKLRWYVHQWKRRFRGERDTITV